MQSIYEDVFIATAITRKAKMVYVERCLVMVEDLMSLIQALSSDAIDIVTNLMQSIASLLSRISACLALILDVIRNAAYLEDYLKGVVGCSHTTPPTQVHAEETVKVDDAQEPTPLGNTNDKYSKRSTEDGVAIIYPSHIASRSIEKETTDCIKARSVSRSPKIRMGTRPLRQSPTDVDFFDIDSKIYNTMRRQRLTTMPKIKHGISALKPLTRDAPMLDIHDIPDSNVCSESTPSEIVDMSDSTSITETTPHRTVESKHEANRQNTRQQSPKKSLAKRIRKFLTPKKLITFGRNLKNPYITLANRYCTYIFS
ncbi:unnamed protein product [Owenia fusiformis]|uniref:Uncharacterized protein n=1 Tax=Owenia fusiformis TaxID=6347 RepID=A0A8S4Q7B8_OWEFU|nr:unnamed protein product [Owenia fusiformis]